LLKFCSLQKGGETWPQRKKQRNVNQRKRKRPLRKKRSASFLLRVAFDVKVRSNPFIFYDIHHTFLTSKTFIIYRSILKKEPLMPVQIHLAINHIPVLGIGLSLFLFAYGMFRNAKEVKIAALLVYLLCSLFIFPTYLSGEKSEDLVEKLPGVSETTIEKHEDFAKPALALAVVGIALAVIVLFSIYSDFKTLTWLPYVLLAFIVVQNLYFLNLAHTGGLIRHSELTPGQLPPSALQDKD
jgi:hypothetical protein